MLRVAGARRADAAVHPIRAPQDVEPHGSLRRAGSPTIGRMTGIAPDDRLARASERNAAVRAWLRAIDPRAPDVCGPRRTLDDLALGTHPDLVGTLWDELDHALPKRCAWIVEGRPALVHPDSGVVFGLAFGTQPIVLRVEAARHPELASAMSEGAAGRSFAGAPPFPASERSWVVAPYGPHLAALARAAFDDAD